MGIITALFALKGGATGHLRLFLATGILGGYTTFSTFSLDAILLWQRHDYLLAAYYVVGRYLADKPRKILYKLAKSKNLWERRTAILATAHFIMKLKQVDDTFAIADILVNDKEDLVNKGTGWMLRTAGGVDRERLLAFLDEHAATMPRVLLRYSIEKLGKKEREHYLELKNLSPS